MVILPGIVGRGLYQHRYVEAARGEGVGDGALVAEIGQGDDDAVDLVAIFLEQRRAPLGLFVSLYCAVLAVFWPQHDGIHAGFGERLNHLFAARFRQLIGEKSTIADDDSHRHFLIDINLLSSALQWFCWELPLDHAFVAGRVDG